MKKIGSLEFFQDVDLNLKFDFNELAEFHGADELGIKEKLLDENGHIKMDFLEELVNVYVDMKIKQKFGRDYHLDVMDDAMNISWDINVESVKRHSKSEWWDGETSKEKINLPKVKTIEEQLTDMSSIPTGHPKDRK
jgi:hypothetical protein